MDSKLPVAKRTRLGYDKFLYERCLEMRARKATTFGTGAPVPEYNGVSPVECVNVDGDEEDEVLSKVRSSKSRKCRENFEKGEKKKKDFHARDDDDVVVMEDSDSDSDDGVERSLSYKESDSEITVIEVVDKGEENEDERVVDENVDDEEQKEDVKEDMALDLKLSDSSSSEEEGENYYKEESDESYREDSRFNHDESLDNSSSCDEAEAEGEGEDDSSDNDEMECRIWKKRDVKCKGKERIAEGGNRGIKITERKKKDVVYRIKGKLIYSSEESSTDEENGKSLYSVHGSSDEDNGTYKKGKDVAKKIAERSANSGFKKKTEPQDVAVNSSKCGQSDPEAKEVVMILSSSSSQSEDENHWKYAHRDGGERRKPIKMAARKKAVKNRDGLTILADSLDGKEEALKKFEKEKPKYKFWFKDEDDKPVEISDFDEHLDDLFKELNMCLTFEEIGSTPQEADNSDHDNGDHCETQTDSATLCSRGIHHLVLDEQIGIICKYCSHVNQEIRHILPTFSKPLQQTRRRGYFVQSGGPIFSDDFRYTDAGRHDSENYTTTGTVWDLVPGTRSTMYEHQREGFEFIWKNLVGGTIIEELEKPLLSSGSGCIISHAPGTGKTRLTIIFLQSFMKLYPDSRPVIIAPKSMLLTWEEEFKKWNINIPFHNLNNLDFSGQENPAAVSVSGQGKDGRNSETLARLVKLLSWKMDKSILGITYALFDKLVRDATKNADCTPVVEKMGKALLKLPSLVVLDEGHTPRNNQSSIYNSLLDVKTERRIILSGTPFQNNFDELYNTLRLVNPKFDGEMKKNLRNISKELKSKWSGHKLRELKGMISPFVHVHKGIILQKSCPGLKDALIHLQPTDMQQELIGVLSTKEVKAGYLELSYAISLISVHPSLLPKRYIQQHQFSAYRDKLKKLESDPYSGAKTKFVVELCRLSEALNEKVLIYSQYIDPLIFLKKQLQTYFGWTEGREVLYMDGGLEAKQRQTLISSLNDPRSKVRVLLASIKACSEGIHLVGASRVVLLDVVWNPSVERQAISRAYRLGQKRVVYTYHLIGEEMDSKKFKVQSAKDRLSEFVFSSNDGESCKENVSKIVSEDEILQKMLQHNDKLGGMFKQIIYQPKESNLVEAFDLVAVEPN